MDRKTLHRFFNGEASIDEGLCIKAWVEESKENAQLFNKERKFFDAISLHTSIDTNVYAKHKNYNLKNISFTLLKIAAVSLVTILISSITIFSGKSDISNAMTIVSVPAGQRTNITLPDGTNVWLNARSIIKYSNNFIQEKRKVFLSGQAFFDVAHNKEVPFVVNTGKYDVEVLGTEFDVESYPEKDIFTTTLMKGRVKVTSPTAPSLKYTLTPEQKIVIADGKAKIEYVDDFAPYRWKEGLICFKDESFYNIMQGMKKYYGINIEIKNKDVLKYSFTGKFRQSDGIDYALKILQKDIKFKFERDKENENIFIN